MKKILFCIPTLRNGGAEKVLVNLVNNMNNKYDITILTIVDDGINKKFLHKNIKYKTIFSKYIKGITQILKILPPKYLYYKYIGEEYDMVISYLEGASARIVSGCNSTKIKKIAWIHTEFSDLKSFTNGFRNFNEAKKCYNKFNSIKCVSNNVKDAFKNISNLDVPIDVIYNTNDTDKINELSKECIDDIEFDANKFNICSVGKIIESKGIDRIARIHKRLIKEGIAIHTYIIGQGREYDKVYKYIESHNLLDSFTFIGYKENPYKYVAKCDLYVCASKKEGFSTSVTESLIVGTPVITTRCSGMDELLGDNNEYGIIVENNEESLYNGLKQLLNNKLQLEYYKKQAIVRGKKFSKEKTVSSVEKMIDTLLTE